MKTLTNALLVAATSAATLLGCSARAATVYYVGTNGVSATTNWSTAANFINESGGSPTTPANNAADFNFNTAVSTSNKVTVNVDGVYPGGGTSGIYGAFPQAWGMFFGHTNGYHNVLIQPGITWVLTASSSTPGGGNFVVAPQNTNAASSGTGNSPSAAYTNFTTITGVNSTFIANCGVFRIEGQSASVFNHYTILDMSGLGTFIYTNTAAASQNLYVAANGSTRSHAILYLAQTNVITMNAAFQVGNLSSTSSNSQPIGVYLGQSNFISTGTGANNMLVGGLGCANVFMKFNPALFGGANLPTAVITAPSGNQSAAICSTSGGAVPGSAVCDLTAGNISWIGNSLKLGVSGTATPNTTANGTLSFNNGLVSFATIVAGSQTTSAGSPGSGAISVGPNGTLQATTGITLGGATGTVTAGTSGTLTVSGALTANSITNGGGTGTVNLINATWNVAINNASATNMAVTTFNASGATNMINVTFITPVLGGSVPVRLHLIAASTLTGGSTLGVTLPASYDPSHPYQGYIDSTTTPGLIDLVLTNAPSSARVLAWAGLNSGSPDGDWDAGLTPDWITNAVATVFNQFDLVNFNDIASPAQTNINLTTSLTPYSLTVSNAASLYTFTGGGNISGITSVSKQGTGTLILDNFTPNNFTGGLTVSAGILQIGTNDSGGSLPNGIVTDNSILVFDRTDNVTVTNLIAGSGAVVSAGGSTLQLSGANTFTGPALVTNNSTLQGGFANSFGNSSGTVVIASGSSLDPDGIGTGRSIIVTGAGVGGNGAIVNSGAVLGDSAGGLTPTLTLGGDTTLSYPNRWDLGSSTGATLSTGGHAYNLTLNGVNSANYFEWRDVHTDTNLANISVVQGFFGIAGNTSLGSPTNSVFLPQGAGMKFFNDDGFNVSVNKQIVMQDGSTLQNGGGANTLNGALVLTNANGSAYCTLNIGGTSLTVNSTVSGDGILYLQGGNSPLIINGNASGLTGGVSAFTGMLTLNSTIGCGITNQSSCALGGTGTANGFVDDGGPFFPGGSNIVGTFTAAAGMTLEPGVAMTMDLRSSTFIGGTNNDFLAVTGDLTVNGNNININAISGTLASGTYTLIDYTGNLIGSFGTVQTLAPSRYILTLSTAALHQVQLIVAGNPNNLVWNNGSADGQWNVQSSPNWTNVTTHAEDVFFTADSVTFDDSITTAANPTTSVVIPAGQSVAPGVITNNSTTNYTISGAGAITGGGNLVKLGSSTLTITTTNSFTGNITVGAGTLKGGATSALGATSGSIVVSNGATLDIDYSLTTKPLVISGNGVGGQGALVNNDGGGASIFSSAPGGLLNVTLTGNTTIGGNNRIDFGQTGSTGAVLNSGGSNYSLTVLGTPYRQWDNVALDGNFGDINVMTTAGGTLGLVGLTTLGNPNNNLAIFPGANVELFNDNGNLANVTVNKNVIIYNNASLQNGGGSNLVLGPITLGVTNGDNSTFNIAGTALIASNVISGLGNLIKTNTSPLILAATNTYTGSTVITTGPLALVGNGSISASTNISLAVNQVLDVSGRSDKTLALSGTQTLTGSGTLRGNLTTTSGSILIPGIAGTGTLTVTNTATLGGTTSMQVGTGFNNLLTATNISYGGILNPVFTPGTLSSGNSFKLFSAITYSNAFASISPSSPGAGLAWDTSQLAINGKLNVINGTPPQLGSIHVNGTNLTITGTGGPANGSYHVWSSTNILTRPLTSWTVVGSGSFDGSGNFSFANTYNPADPARFFIVVEP